MKCVRLGPILLAAIAFAQPADKLNADLLSLSGPSLPAVSQQVANDIVALAEPDAQPSRRVVQDFALELTSALAGKTRTADNVSQLSNAIVDVLHRGGVPASQYRASLDRARQALIAMGVSPQPAQRVADRLRILGQEVRGPEDPPVRPQLAPK